MLSFHLGKIPVTVHPAFLFMGVILATSLGNDIPVLAMWLVILFLSVMAHELGHAFAGIGFGLTPRIDLHGMGGTTSWQHKDVSTAKKILISVAGPAVGILFGGILYLLQPSIAASNASRFARIAVFLLIEVNLYWGLLNLLPMMPLDGGNAMAHALGHAMGSKGITIAHAISLVVAIAAGLYAYVAGYGWWPVLLSGMFAFQNIRAIRPAPKNNEPPVAPQRW
jgi:Zn-dependent protease